MITDLRLSLIAFVMLVIAAIVIRTILRLTAPLFDQVQQRLGALSTQVQENLAGVQVVKAFAREPHAIAGYKERNTAYMEQNIRVGYLTVTVMPLLTIVTNLGMVAVIWWGGFDTIGGRLSVGQLVAFVNYLMIGMAPLMLLSNMLTMISRANVSAARVIEVLDTEPAIRVPATPHQPKKTEGHVIFDEVSFAYGNDSMMLGATAAEPQVAPNGRAAETTAPHANGAPARPLETNGHLSPGREPAANGEGFPGNGREAVLDGISFEAAAGQRIAILGATGAGKSTLVHLIPRFYDVTGGSIRIDGEDVRNWDLHALRSRIGVVLQQNTLFSGTVYENIAYGRPNATLDEVEEAAHIAQAHEFIATLPDGYESVVEARGANFSGGQKQRIAIARALLMQPAILILDDCTSAVDMDTEFKILEALDTVMKRCTTFLVAQRINSVVDADQILILEAGQIVARGNHRALIASSPIYQEIYNSQLDVEEMTGLLAEK
jgi:ATP-binding cassette, subfamily B, multidrug efflux pump